MTAPTLPPLAPDRPGRYLLRNGDSVDVASRDEGGHWRGVNGFMWNEDGRYAFSPVAAYCWDIIARAPDDREWCLALAQQLAGAHGYVCVPREPTSRRFQCPFCDQEHESGIYNGADISCCGEIGKCTPMIAAAPGAKP